MSAESAWLSFDEELRKLGGEVHSGGLLTPGGKYGKHKERGGLPLLGGTVRLNDDESFRSGVSKPTRGKGFVQNQWAPPKKIAHN